MLNTKVSLLNDLIEALLVWSMCMYSTLDVVMFQVDLQCKVPGSGGCYYPEHLPHCWYVTNQLRQLAICCDTAYRKWRGWVGMGWGTIINNRTCNSIPTQLAARGCVLLLEDTYTS